MYTVLHELLSRFTLRTPRCYNSNGMALIVLFNENKKKNVSINLFQDHGYSVVASSSTAVKQDYNEYMWTLRRDFNEPHLYAAETASVMERDNISNIGREELAGLHI